jgi:hypothetical protein
VEDPNNIGGDIITDEV